MPYEAFKVDMIWSLKLPFDLFWFILMILISTFQGVITFGFFFHWSMPLGKDYAFIWVYNIIKLNWTLWTKLGDLQTLVPIPELQHGPLPLKCYGLGSVPQLLILPMFSHFNSQLSLPRSLGVRQIYNIFE